MTTDDAPEAEPLDDSLVAEPSLQEHLMRQAELAELTEEELEAMRHLVSSLDDRGFLVVGEFFSGWASER